MTDGIIEINGVMWKIALMLDRDRNETSNSEAACHLVVQKPDDVRPEGTQQAFSVMEIPEGSLVKELSN